VSADLEEEVEVSAKLVKEAEVSAKLEEEVGVEIKTSKIEIIKHLIVVNEVRA
jgi:hypothetical protein